MTLPVYWDERKKLWWFRKRVPTDLLASYEEHTGKKSGMVKVSLGQDEKAARLLAVTQLEKFNDLMRYLRSRAHISTSSTWRTRVDLWMSGMTKVLKRTLDLELLQNLRELVEMELSAMNDKLEAEGGDVWVSPNAKFNRKEMRLADYIKYLQNNQRLLHIHERMFLEPNYNPTKELEESRILLENNELRVRDYILNALQQGKLGVSPANPASIVSNKPTITQAIDKWIEKNKPRERSIVEWRYAVKRFVELHGDLTVDAIDDSHVVAFRQALAKIPSRLPKTVLNKSLPELVRLADTGKFTGRGKERSPASINKLLVALNSILEVMVDDGVIPRNPAKKKLLAKDNDGTQRPPYEMDELKALFTSEMYKSNYWNSPAKAANKPWRFWLPLISLYTGFRIEEVSKLKISDVRQLDGISYFSINTEGGRKLKTKAAIRNVVIHDNILKAGFMRFVEEQKQEGHNLLFNDRTGAADGRLSGSMTNWYRRYAEEIGIRNNGKTFHSFRDNYNDACENAGLTDRQISRLMGHQLQGAKKSYGNGLWLKTTADLLRRVRYPDLDLSHLYIQQKAVKKPLRILSFSKEIK